MKKTYLGNTRVRRINGTRKDYRTVGVNLDRKNAISLAKSILKTTKDRKVNKVVLTTFKDRVNEDGMRMLVSAY